MIMSFYREIKGHEFINEFKVWVDNMTITTYEVEISNNEVLNKIKQIAKEKQKSEKQIIVDILEKSVKYLKTKETELQEEKEHVLSLDELVGRYSTDEPFDAVEDKKRMMRGEL